MHTTTALKILITIIVLTIAIVALNSCDCLCNSSWEKDLTKILEAKYNNAPILCALNGLNNDRISVTFKNEKGKKKSYIFSRGEFEDMALSNNDDYQELGRIGLSIPRGNNKALKA